MKGWFVGLFVCVGLLMGCGREARFVETPLPSPTETPMVVPTADATIEVVPTLDEVTPTVEAVPTPDWIVLPLKVYILDDESELFSSGRTVGEMPAIYTKVNEIWSQANIRFEVQGVERAKMPASTMLAISSAQFDPFFNGIGRDFTLPNPALINAFYVKQVGRANGINPFGARLFFVMDTPSVHDERVTSHEIGHILGLQHNLQDSTQLMYSGTNGMGLSAEEVVVARYNAGKLLEQFQ